MKAAVLDERLVDVQADEEFAREVLSRIPLEAADGLVRQLEAKSRTFQTLLSRDRLPALDAEAACRLLRATGAVRRRAEAILAAVGLDGLRDSWWTLLYGPQSLDARFSHFCRTVEAACARGEAIDLAGEALHYTFPDRYWLWTRWVWNPRTQTGALRFIVPDWQALAAPSLGEVYLRVGEAVAYAKVAREALGLFSHVQLKGSPFLNDVHLAVVYTLYMFTALRMRMTREFTQVLPPPWEVVGRLLGVRLEGGEDAQAGA